MKKHKYLIERKGLNQGIYFITKKDAKNFIKIAIERELGKKEDYKIIKF